ncbi:MAG: hypothetical protein Q8S47_10020, partial [Phenylobacterium sp.]|nr:hypothetical protein [Phenylobacterium sp.]
MSWSDWIPAITSSTLLGAVGFLVGTAYKARVERSIQHSFDKKLEGLRGTIRRSDEQIAAMRSGALSGLQNRQANLDRRRLEAVENLWAESVTFGRYRSLAALAPAMDIIMKKATGSGSDALKAREYAEVMLRSAGLDDPKPMSIEPDKERPFLDPVCWALFSAYRQSCTYPAMLMHLAKFGMGPDVLEQSTPAVLTTLKAALPEQATYIDQQGIGSLFHLLQPLEDKLLAALIGSLSGRESSDEAVRHAAEIIEKVQVADA